MGRREDFARTMRHVRPERLLIDFGGNPLSTMEGESENKLLEFLGFPKKPEQNLPFGKTRRLDERLLQYFDVDTRSVGEILTPQDSHYQVLSPTEYIDEWGVRRRFTGLYWEGVSTPLKGASLAELNAYRFPDPDSIDERVIAAHAARAKELYENTDYVICAEHPVYGIFELGCWMCGFEDFLARMALDEEWVCRFFERVLEYQKKVIERYYTAVGPYIHYTSSGDDFATQNAPFISPEMFRTLVKPYFQERISYTKRFTKAKYLHHSCGSVFRLIDDLVDCGVEILNPIQPKATGMQPRALKEAYGDKIVFHGGIDTQELLPFADEREIEETVHETIEMLNQNGGYIFAAAHNIQPDVNPRSLTVMLNAARKYREA